MKPFVGKGEIVTCENGHELYRITEDIIGSTLCKADQFEPLDSDVQEPIEHAEMEPCPRCGALWSGNDDGIARIHFKDGWR